MSLKGPRFYEFGEFRLDTRLRTLSKRGETLPLSSRNFDLLVYLVENEGRILGHDELLENVWSGTFVEQSNLKKGIWTIRKLLEDGASQESFIKTVPRQGYSFVAPVTALTSDADQALRLSETEVILEREEIDDVRSLPNAKRRRGMLMVVLMFAVVIVAVVGAIYWGSRAKTSSDTSSFTPDNVQLTRLTSLGNLVNVVISPDGEYAAYATHSDEGQSLWLKHIESGNTRQIIAPADVAYYSWNFSADNAFVYFIRKSHSDGTAAIFRIPFLGGEERRISDSADGNLTFSPDGKRLAFVRIVNKTLKIVTADLDGANEAGIDLPNGRLWSLSWTPDNRSLLYAKQDTVSGTTTYSAEEIALNGGDRRVIVPPQKQRLHRAAWLPDGSGLILNAEDPETEALQLWYQPYPEGERKRITNDLNSYHYFSFAADTNSLVSMRASFLSGVTVADQNGKNVREIVPESSVASHPVWAPDDSIVFSSMESGRPEVWSIRPDGRSKKQLTFEGNGKNFRPSASADAKTIVFTSNRSGKSQVWQMDVDGRNARQLTDAEAVSYGRLSNDGEFLIYYAWIAPNGWTLFRKPLSDGDAVAITQTDTGVWDISPDGRSIAYEFEESENARPRIAIRTIDTIDKPTVLDLAVSYDALRWTRDGKALTYATQSDGHSKVMVQPIGGSPHEIMDLGTKIIYSLDWSWDAKSLVLASGNNFTDAVLIKFRDNSSR